MDAFKEWIIYSGKTQKHYADLMGISAQYLNILLNGRQKYSPRLCKLIYKITDGEVKRSYLRKDLFRDGD